MGGKEFETGYTPFQGVVKKKRHESKKVGVFQDFWNVSLHRADQRILPLKGKATAKRDCLRIQNFFKKRIFIKF